MSPFQLNSFRMSGVTVTDCQEVLSLLTYLADYFKAFLFRDEDYYDKYF
jgi:hypothetical protein